MPKMPGGKWNRLLPAAHLTRIQGNMLIWSSGNDTRMMRITGKRMKMYRKTRWICLRSITVRILQLRKTGDMERKSVDFVFKLFCLIFMFFFIGALSVTFWFSTCYDGAPLRSPVLEKGVILGVLPKQR